VDCEAIQRLGSWLGGIDGVKGLVVLGHAGEGTFLTIEEQVSVIKAFVRSVIAGITGEGTEVAALEAKRAKEAGAAAGLLYPSHGWLHFGYQPGAPQDRYRRVYEVSAKTEGLLPSLHMSGIQYITALSIFFIQWISKTVSPLDTRCLFLGRYPKPC
jgi:hypothetical protein